MEDRNRLSDYLVTIAFDIILKVGTAPEDMLKRRSKESLESPSLADGLIRQLRPEWANIMNRVNMHKRTDINSLLLHKKSSVMVKGLHSRWEKLAQWLSEGLRLTSTGVGQLPFDRFDAFWRTATCDLTFRGFRHEAHHHESFTQLAFFLRDHERDPANFLLPGEKHFRDFAAGMERWSRGRRFCNTNNGRIGCVPKAVVAGGIICVLYGDRTPYALRPSGRGRYTLIGECFVHGLMDGEAMTMRHIRDSDSRLQ
jgi:hypothetical protein